MFWWNFDGKGAKKRKAPMRWDTFPGGNAAVNELPTPKWPAHAGSSLANTFDHLFCLAQVSPSSTFSDITFEVGAGVCAQARNFHAHRCIVAAWSRPLRARIHTAASAAAAAVSSAFDSTGGGRFAGCGKAVKKKESAENEDTATKAALQRASVHASGFAGGLRVSLPNVDPSTFALLLRFMYGSRIGAVDGKTARPNEGVGQCEGGGSLAKRGHMDNRANPPTLSSTMALLALAFDMEVLPLRDYCHDLLMREDPFPAQGIEAGSVFHIHDCCFILRFADRHAIPVLARRCVRFITANIGEMVSSAACSPSTSTLDAHGPRYQRRRAPICDLDGVHLKLVLEELAMRFSGAAFGAKMALAAVLTWLEWRFHQPMYSHTFFQDLECSEYADLFARIDWSCISEQDAHDVLCRRGSFLKKRWQKLIKKFTSSSETADAKKPAEDGSGGGDRFAIARSSKSIARAISVHLATDGSNDGKQTTVGACASPSHAPGASAHIGRVLSSAPSSPPAVVPRPMLSTTSRGNDVADNDVVGHGGAIVIGNDGREVLTVVPLM